MFVVIAGEPRPDLRAHVTAMASALRGATGKLGIWCDEQRGLAAVGIARGIQPEDVFDTQPYVDDRLCFVADGMVDDRAALATTLGIPTPQLASMSDTELLYRAYQCYGEDLPHVVYGHYSFVALHRDTGRIVLSGAHINSHPIYYAERGGTFVAASQMGAMLAHPAIPRRPNLTALSLLVAPKAVQGVTSIDNVSLLPAATSLTRSPGVPITTHRWWNPEDISPIRYADERQYVEYAVQLFERSVARALSAANGVNATCSGGLDSSLITAFAARQLHARGQRFTAYISVIEEGLKGEFRPNWDHDESHLVRDLAELYGNVDLVIVRPRGRCFLDIMPQIHAFCHTAVRNTSNHLWVDTMAQATLAQGKCVLLFGGMGNAITSLEGRSVRSILFTEGRWRKAMQLARRDGSLGGQPAWKALGMELRFRLGDLFLPRPKPKERVGAYLFRPAYKQQIQSLLDERVTPMRGREGQVQFAMPRGKFCAADGFALWGLEDRDPIADRRLIEASLAFPMEAHMAGGRSRGLAREMGAGIVPDSIRLRRNRGAQSPETASIIQLHAGRYRTALEALRSSPACNEIFDFDAAAKTMDRVAAGQGNLTDAYILERLIDAGSLIKEMGF